MKNEIIEISKKIKGNILLIGNYDNKVLKIINNNKNIFSCDVLSENSHGKANKKFSLKKNFYISDLRKKYKKKKIDYILVEENLVNKYYKTFIKDSIYITKGKIIYICNSKSDIERIQKRYKRYKTSIEIKKYKNGFIISINVEEAKTNKIKDLYYCIIDTFINIIDIISDILVS